MKSQGQEQPIKDLHGQLRELFLFSLFALTPGAKAPRRCVLQITKQKRISARQATPKPNRQIPSTQSTREEEGPGLGIVSPIWWCKQDPSSTRTFQQMFQIRGS